MSREVLVVLAALGSTLAGFVLLGVRWARAAACVAIEEMFRQEYDGSAVCLGDLILWLASRRTADPRIRFEEWKAHLDECRTLTDRPCLPEAIHLLVVGRCQPLVRPVRSVVDPPAPDAGFGATLMQQMFDLWINPEVTRRNGTIAAGEVHRALVVMAPGRPLEVKLNDEVSWIATLEARRTIAAGEPVTSADVDLDSLSGLRPESIDPNAGWTGFVTVAGHRIAAFDFRRNRLIAWRHLDQAQAHVDAVRLGRFHRRAAIRRLVAAVSETVTAIELTMSDEVSLTPPQVRRHLRRAAELGNVPECASDAADFLGYLERAGHVRRAALRRATLQRLRDHVLGLVQVAEMRVGDRPDVAPS